MLHEMLIGLLIHWCVILVLQILGFEPMRVIFGNFWDNKGE